MSDQNNGAVGNVWPEQEIVYKWLDNRGIALVHQDVMPLLEALTAPRRKLDKRIVELERQNLALLNGADRYLRITMNGMMDRQKDAAERITALKIDRDTWMGKYTKLRHAD